MSYKILIFDFEVFVHDWLVVFSTIDGSEVTVIHNDNDALKKVMYQRGVIFGGYNVKHYDNFIAQSILAGGTPEQVKECNDWIIAQGKNGWEFPMLQGIPREFIAFDLMDDIAVPISLKAIEANIGDNIVESKIDFHVQHKLSKQELDEVIYYCKNDVKATCKLYQLRKTYLDAKVSVGAMKGWDEAKSLPLTNPVLTSRFLEAKLQPHDDEFEYDPPAGLILNKYKEPLEFYKVIDYDKNLELEVAGVMQHYGWGGIHGAREHYIDASDDEYKIVDIDVGSYYPSMMVKLGYISRNIPSAEGYIKIYEDRLKAKHMGTPEGDIIAKNYKLILNSTYGALKCGTRVARNAEQAKAMGAIKGGFANALFDAKMANAICITGQLFLTDLVEKLEAIEGMSLIQTNTDGIMIKYPVKAEKQLVDIVDNWQERSKMNMEYKIIKRICCQKDVNNYIMVEGETFIFENGVKKITKPDKNSITVKGGWVSLYKGGTWQNNSLVIVHKCLVNYFVDGTTPEETIAKADNIHDFQIVCKTSSKFNGTIHIVNGAEVAAQMCNRVYATTDTKYGMIYKTKNGSKYKFPDVPEHCIIDNDNHLKLDDIDKQYYIDLAYKRINDYKGTPIKKSTTRKRKEKAEMATATAKEDYSKLNILQKLTKARNEFAKRGVKKSGKNRYIGYAYYELDDIVPVVLDIFEKLGLYHEPTFFDNTAYMRVFNVDNLEEIPREFMLPMVHIEPNKGQNACQAQASEVTYYTRYLYLMMMQITENDSFDAAQKDDTEDKPVETKKKQPPATKEERKEAVKEMTTGSITDAQMKSIKEGLKKLRASEENHEVYINEVVKKMKDAKEGKLVLTTEDAENIMLEIGKKIEAENERKQQKD